MSIADLYLEGRGRMLALAADLSDAEAEAPVRACPGWTVRDVFAHQAGVAVDILAGRLEGVATDPWTACQVAERADRTLAEITAEWAEAGQQVDGALAAMGDQADFRLVIDQWTHEQDVRGTVGRPGARTGAAAAFSAESALAGVGFSWQQETRPAIRVKTESVDRVIGAGEPVATLSTTDFELARLLLGRRTPQQVAALDWDGDPAPHVGALHIFGPAAEPVVE